MDSLVIHKLAKTLGIISAQAQFVPADDKLAHGDHAPSV
jgi:hypothetical protein